MDDNNGKKEIVKINGHEAITSPEFVFNLQKYLRVVPTIDPNSNERVWFIAGKI